MLKRRLGRTELLVSAISFGALPIQRCSLQEAGPVLHKALDEGINFFDTARAYSDSEEKIGQHLAKRRGEYYLASKSMARTAQQMHQDIELSLRLMKTDFLELYQIHNIKRREDLDSVLAPEGALKALLEKQKKGYIKYIGITGHNFELLTEAVKTNLFDTVQAPYNIIEQIAQEELFPVAKLLDLGLIVMKPLAGGQLTQKELALRFILQDEKLIAIPGMDKVEHIQENLLAVRPHRSITQNELNLLQNEAEIVGKEFCRRCGYCLPCTVGIDIPQVFIFRLQYKRYGLTKAIPERYKKLDVKASACQNCNLCEKRCPYDIPIQKWLQEVVAEFES